MDIIHNLILASETIFSFEYLYYVFLGTIVGIIIGALPGIGPTLGIAISLPLTYTLSAVNAMIFLVSIYCGAMYGGAISAILFNTPGTGSATATTMEGYPMAQKGEAILALSLSALCSSFGGIIAAILVIFITPLLVEFMLIFWTPEYLMLSIFGIAIVILVSTKGNIIKGLISASFGLLLTTIGIAPITVDIRYTFMRPEIYDGIGYLPAIIGLFGVAEVFRLSGKKTYSIAEKIEGKGQKHLLKAIKLLIKHKISFIRSTLIGLFIGAVPGAGGSISNFVAYAVAKNFSKNIELWGKGNPEGVIASESSNNATVAGSLIPTFVFGIPGSGAAAALLAGLYLHGLRPGMQLFTGEGLVFTNSVYLSIILSHIIILIFGVTLVHKLGVAVLFKKEYIIIIIIILSTLGIYGYNQNYFDVYQIVIFGIIGYFFGKYKYPVIPALIAIILGTMIEGDLFRSLDLSGGSFSIFLNRPISLFLVIVTATVLTVPFLRRLLILIKR